MSRGGTTTHDRAPSGFSGTEWLFCLALDLSLATKLVFHFFHDVLFIAIFTLLAVLADDLALTFGDWVVPVLVRSHKNLTLVDVVSVQEIELVAEELQVELADALINCSSVSHALSNRPFQFSNICLVPIVRLPQFLVFFLLNFRVHLLEFFQLMLAKELIARNHWVVFNFFICHRLISPLNVLRLWLWLLLLGWLSLVKAQFLKFFSCLLP